MFAAATSSLAHRVFAPRAFARPPRGPDPRPNPIRQSPRKATTPRLARLPNAAADRTTTETVASAADVSALLLVGFHPDEIQPLTELVGSIAAELDLAQEIGVALVNRKSLNKTFASLLEDDDEEEDDEEDEEEEEEEDEEKGDVSNAADGMDDWDDEDLDASFDGYEVHPGDWSPDDDESDDDDSLPPLSNILPPAARCVLLRGDGAKALMPHLRWEMQSAGFEPAVFGAFTAATQDATIARVASNVVEAHERHWRLSGDPESPANAKEPESPYAETPSSEALWATNTAWEGEEGWSPDDAVPVLNVVTDAATVPDPPPFGVGDYFREDATAIVALDGVVGESLRGALLDAVTEPGWDHANAASPPTPKWDRSMTDGINGKTEEDSEEDPEEILIGLQSGSYGTFRPAPGSWGLTESALADVVSHPATATFLSRIAALYPDYHVRTMPADALEPDGVPGTSPGSSGRRIATAVANAAVYGDDFKWHLDADPVRFFFNLCSLWTIRLTTVLFCVTGGAASVVALRRTVRDVRQQVRRSTALRVRAGVPERGRLDRGHERRDAGARSGHRNRGVRETRAGAGAPDGPGRAAQGIHAESRRGGAQVLARAEAVLLSQASGGSAEALATGVGQAGELRDGAGALVALRGRRGVERVKRDGRGAPVRFSRAE